MPLTYAGRLDPMASGLLLILAGEETKHKEKYLNLDKKYEFKVLFGFATDTYDILGKLGKATNQARLSLAEIKEAELKKMIQVNLEQFTGNFIQSYPPYSSKTVKGKPLFQYAREGKKVKAPEREVVVKKIALGKISTITGKKLLQNIEKRIGKVKGDFRQKEIATLWRKNLSKKEGYKFFIADFSITCGGGTYVRGIANSLGQKIKLPALAFSIKRTQIGKWRQVA